MPPVRMYQDDCKTGADAQEAVARTRLFRQQAFRQQPAAPGPVAPTRPAASDILPAAASIVLDGDPVPELPAPRSVARIVKATARHFGVTYAEMVGGRRHFPLVRYRQIAMYLAYKITGRSYPEIGRRLGGRDHTTILHGVRTIEQYVDACHADMARHIAAICDGLDVPFMFEQDGEKSSIQLPPLFECRNKRYWTPQEDAILRRMYEQEGRSARDTAKAIGRAPGAVYMRAYKIGITAETRGRLPKVLP